MSFKVGDTVKCVVASLHSGLVAGRLYTVEGIDALGNLMLDGLIGVYGPERFALSEFKPGDKVRCIDTAGIADRLTTGQVYTIGSVKTAVWVVEAGDWFHPDRFELIDAPLPTINTPSDLDFFKNPVEPGHCVCRIPRELCRYHQ